MAAAGLEGGLRLAGTGAGFREVPQVADNVAEVGDMISGLPLGRFLQVSMFGSPLDPRSSDPDHLSCRSVLSG